MKIRILSDVHFEFYKTEDMSDEFMNSILPECVDDNNTILIMAGDMCTYKSPDTFKQFLDLIHDRFYAMLYVIGNHEYYHSNFSDNQNISMFDKYKKLHILNNRSILINGINFIGSTLWTDCENLNPNSILRVGQGLNDFWVITRNHETIDTARFDVHYMLEEFKKSLEFISCEVERSTNKNVVITHHAPSFESVDAQFRDSDINGGFGSDLSEFILEQEPDTWIHGHMHNSSNYMIGNTNVIANPRGYPRIHQNIKYENNDYDNMLSITV